MVELRKRKTVDEPVASQPAAKKQASKSTADEASKQGSVGGAETEKPEKPVKPTNGSGKMETGDAISLEGFGGEIETHTGEKTNLNKLVSDSAAGVVLFTYPKASTPGCTTQACLFRDNFTHLTNAGLSVYGLSMDSPKSNTTFATKQSLPYPLLCDPSANLVSAIGMKKPPKNVTRGVVVIDKKGKVLVWEQGGPQRTLDVVLDAISSVSSSLEDHSKTTGAGAAAESPSPKQNDYDDSIATSKTTEINEQQKQNDERIQAAETAAEVADSAEKVDKDVVLGPSS